MSSRLVWPGLYIPMLLQLKKKTGRWHTFVITALRGRWPEACQRSEASDVFRVTSGSLSETIPKQILKLEAVSQRDAA